MKRRMQAWGQVIEGLDEALSVLALRELGVFAALGEGPATVTTLGERFGVAPRRLRSLLDVACLVGFARREGEAFALMPGDAALFDPAGPWARQLGHGTVAEIMGSRVDLLETLRTDTPAAHAGPGGEVTAERRDRFLRFLHARSIEVADEVAGLISLLGPVGRIADLGSGAGTYAHALLSRHAGASAVLVDRPNAGPTIAGLAAELGVAERVRHSAVDLMQSGTAGDYGAGFDVILYSNMVHNYGVAANRFMIGEAAERLAPGGLLAIKDIEVEADRSGPAGALRFGLTMARVTAEGDVYPSAEVAGWCRSAGLEVAHIFGLRNSPTQYLLVARRPG